MHVDVARTTGSTFSILSISIMASSIESFKIDGFAAATFTPYNDDGSVDYAGVAAHCADLAKHGVRFAFSASCDC